MNVLVTGGAGFIGSHVCERLLGLGHAVWTLDDLNSFYSVHLKKQNLAALARAGGRFEFVQGDLTVSGLCQSTFFLRPL